MGRRLVACENRQVTGGTWAGTGAGRGGRDWQRCVQVGGVSIDSWNQTGRRRGGGGGGWADDASPLGPEEISRKINSVISDALSHPSELCKHAHVFVNPYLLY